MFRWFARAVLLSALLLAGCPAPAPVPAALPNEDSYLAQREQMVTTQIEQRGVSDAAVLNVLLTVPPPSLRPAGPDRPGLRRSPAYHLRADHLPALHRRPHVRSAPSSPRRQGAGDRHGQRLPSRSPGELGAETFTIEIIPELANQGRIVCRSWLHKVQVRNADGYFGWEEHAPFDAIIVTAASDHLPQPLANQLAEGGRLVVPIGPVGSVQTLWLFEKRDGELEATNLGAVGSSLHAPPAD